MSKNTVYLLSDEAEDTLPSIEKNPTVDSIEDTLKVKILVDAYNKYSLTELENLLCKNEKH